MKKLLFQTILVALVVLPCIFLLEFGLRYTIFAPWELIDIISNPDHRMTSVFHNGVNDDGIREQVNADDYRSDDYNVIFLGDSFIYGWRVYPHEAIPAQFERLARDAGFSSVRSVNFGWVSSSPLLSKRLLKDIGSKYKPDLIVLAIDMTDIFDDLLYEKILNRERLFAFGGLFPAITLAISRANQRLGRSDRFSTLLFGVPANRFFIVGAPLEETAPHFKNLMRHVDEIASYSRNTLKAPFVTVVLPRNFQYDRTLSPQSWENDRYPPLGEFVLEPFKFFSSIAPSRGYPIFDILPEFQQTDLYPTTFIDDPHYNELGCEVAANAIFERVNKIPGLLPTPDVEKATVNVDPSSH